MIKLTGETFKNILGNVLSSNCKHMEQSLKVVSFIIFNKTGPLIFKDCSGRKEDSKCLVVIRWHAYLFFELFLSLNDSISKKKGGNIKVIRFIIGQAGCESDVLELKLYTQVTEYLLT